MDDSSPCELELTPDLIEYAKAVAIKEAQKRCPKNVVYDDVVQEVLLHLISKPPKYDPTRGASEKTLIYTIVQRGVLKYIGRQCRHAKRFRQVVEQEPDVSNEPEGKLLGPRAGTTAGRERMIGVMDAEDADDATPQRNSAAERRPSDLTTKSLTTDDVLEFIDSEESRELCRLYMQCKCSFTVSGGSASVGMFRLLALGLPLREQPGRQRFDAALAARLRIGLWLAEFNAQIELADAFRLVGHAPSSFARFRHAERTARRPAGIAAACNSGVVGQSGRRSLSRKHNAACSTHRRNRNHRQRCRRWPSRLP